MGNYFAESGLLVGFFLPGDSLLVTAGFLASQGKLNIEILIIGCFLCAVLGDNVGYWTGSTFGRRLFRKETYKKHLVTTQKFYEKHRKKTIVLSRFVPIVAGIGAMNYRTFMFYNLIGGLVWTVGVTLLGFFLGKSLPPKQVDKYLLPIILGIIIVSLIPSIIHLLQESRSSQR
jgi:membrane-associated protein